MEALRAAPDGLDTRELAKAVMRAKGLDVDERVFRKSPAKLSSSPNSAGAQRLVKRSPTPQCAN